ncbi:MAG: AAA family ATPase, partial [Candidatus Lokiarchaeota archaeon]|nr:AAA family ATPase [Candidatus Lokiarchaeota archaeon]
LDKPIPFEVLNSLRIKMEDFTSALNTIEPSALREVVISQPKETWDDVGGLEDAKLQLREIIEWPLKYPELYSHLSSKPPNGILLYGPPGTGKTLLARALAHESEINFISVKGPEFLSKWVGESEKAVRETFRKARSAAPCIIFFDEIDAIAGMRGRSAGSEVTDQVISQLLTEMDGLEDLKDVILLAATNRPDMLDPALLRSGRFGKHIEIPMPDFETRKNIFKIHLKNKPLAEDINYDKLAESLEDYTGADIQALCEEATLLTIRKNIPIVNEKKQEIQDYQEQLEQLQLEKASSKDISELEDKIKVVQSKLVSKIEIEQAEFDKAIDKIIKGADRAKKVHDQYSKESEDMYR